MFYGCWSSRSYPKWFCRDNFKLVRTVRRGGSFPHTATFYHWKRDSSNDDFYLSESGDVVLMYIHPDGDAKVKYSESDEIRFYETDIPFFKGWIGACCFYDEISQRDWRELDKFCFLLENPDKEY